MKNKKFDYRDWIKKNKFILTADHKIELVTEIKMNLMPEAGGTEDEKYVHQSKGVYVLKGKEQDPNAEKFTRDDNGSYTSMGSTGGQDGGEEKPKVNIFDKPKQEPKAEPKQEPKAEPKQSYDLANDPENRGSQGEHGEDSRGTDWDGSYDEPIFDEDDWKKAYADNQGDEGKLNQLKWYGEKQGWGNNGELDSSELPQQEPEPETDLSSGNSFSATPEQTQQMTSGRTQTHASRDQLESQFFDLNDEDNKTMEPYMDAFDTIIDDIDDAWIDDDYGTYQKHLKRYERAHKNLSKRLSKFDNSTHDARKANEPQL